MDTTTQHYDSVADSFAQAHEIAVAGTPEKLFEWTYHVERGAARSPRTELNRMKSWWRLKQVLPLIREGDRLLDAGCGDGTDSLIFAALKNARTFGVDLNQQRLETANQRRTQWGRYLDWADDKVVFEPMSVFNLSMSDDSFDIVWCNQAIEHIHPLPEFFSEVHRVLRPGGFLAIANINALSPYAQARMFRRRGFRFFKQGMTDPRTGETVQYAVELLRSPYRVRRQLREIGFVDSRLCFSGCIPSPVAAFHALTTPIYRADRFLSKTPVRSILAYDYVIVARKS